MVYIIRLAFFLFLLNPHATLLAGEGTIKLTELTVHARMRSEQIQMVPISISAFSATDIEDADIDDTAKFIELSPNINLNQSQSAGTSFLTIRGISQVRNGEPPVATIVNGVLQINARQFTRELYDIEQIEVLRGPQSALYGRNAIGGAILITTQRPGNQWKSHWRFSYGQENEYLGQLSVGGALIDDQLFLRMAGRYLEHDGNYNNITLNQKVDFKKDYSFNTQINWLPTDRLEMEVNFAFNRHRGGGLNFQYQPAILAANGINLASDTPFPFDFSRANADSVTKHFIANNRSHNQRKIEEVSLKLEYFADFATFTSISSWNHLEEYISGDQFAYSADLTRDFGGGFVVDGGQSQYVNIDAISQEFRISSNEDNDFRWLLGSYALFTDRFVSSTTSDDNGFGILYIDHQPSTDPRNPTRTFLADDNDNTAWAVFANLAYNFTEKLEANFAWRYDQDRRRQKVSPFNTAGEPGAVNYATFSQFQPQAALTYQLLDNLNLFSSWGIGFRSGQFNQNSIAEAAKASGLNGVKDVTDREKTENIEIGFKSNWLNNSMRINGSLFYTKQSNRPYFVFIGEVGAQVLVNINEVEIIGGELEIQKQWFEGFNSYLALGYSSSSIKNYALNNALSGNYAPYIPEYTLNTGIQYRHPFNAHIGMLTRVDFQRLGKQYWDPENSTARSALNLLNLKIGLEDPKKQWSIMFKVDNALNEAYNSEWVRGGFAHPAPPRHWGIDFQWRY